MRAKKIYEASGFQRGGDFLDGLGVGRVEERRRSGYESFGEWLESYKFRSSDIIREAWNNPGWYIGDPKKEMDIFNGLSIDEMDSRRYPEEWEMCRQLMEDIFSMNYWAGEIAIYEDPKYLTYLPEVQEGMEKEIEDDFEDRRFLENILKYFISQWPGARKLKNPYESKKH